MVKQGKPPAFITRSTQGQNNSCIVPSHHGFTFKDCEKCDSWSPHHWLFSNEIVAGWAHKDPRIKARQSHHNTHIKNFWHLKPVASSKTFMAVTAATLGLGSLWAEWGISRPTDHSSRCHPEVLPRMTRNTSPVWWEIPVSNTAHLRIVWLIRATTPFPALPPCLAAKLKRNGRSGPGRTCARAFTSFLISDGVGRVREQK